MFGAVAFTVILRMGRALNYFVISYSVDTQGIYLSKDILFNYKQFCFHSSYIS